MRDGGMTVPNLPNLSNLSKSPEKLKMKITAPGALTTVQDAGRTGYMSKGISPGGAMDVFSMKIANILVGNSPCDGVLEMTLTGVTAEFSSTEVIAVTGADMQPEINGKKIKMYASYEVSPGDVLKLGSAQSGMRAYLAVSGGFDIPPVMGSMSTNLKCAFGGYNGRALKRGDEIPLRQSVGLTLVGKRHAEGEARSYDDSITLRVIPGPQDDLFTEKGLSTFFSSEYTVSSKSDRMGVRLDGEKAESKNGVDIISDGIALGSVQIPSAGTPIIMTADRQTTGGYAKIATVIGADMYKIAQARPGTRVRFEKTDFKTAVKLKRKEERRLKLLIYNFSFSK